MARSPKGFAPNRSLRRSGSSIKPNIKIYAFCEGKNTEPYFINIFKELHGNGLVYVEPKGAVGVPMSVVTEACNKKKELELKSRRSLDPLDKLFEVWAIFDRDEHLNVPQAFEKAKANNVYVAYSNPCFELWPYLHFTDQTAHIHRWDLQRQLQNIIPAYDANGAKTVCPSSLPPNSYNLARQKAIRLKLMHESVGTPMQNPYTDVHELFDKIIENGKKSNKKI